MFHFFLWLGRLVGSTANVSNPHCAYGFDGCSVLRHCDRCMVKTACQRGDRQRLEQLMANVVASGESLVDRHGWTFLHFACMFCHWDCIEYLVSDFGLSWQERDGPFVFSPAMFLLVRFGIHMKDPSFATGGLHGLALLRAAVHACVEDVPASPQVLLSGLDAVAFATGLVCGHAVVAPVWNLSDLSDDFSDISQPCGWFNFLPSSLTMQNGNLLYILQGMHMDWLRCKKEGDQTRLDDVCQHQAASTLCVIEQLQLPNTTKSASTWFEKSSFETLLFAIFMNCVEAVRHILRLEPQAGNEINEVCKCHALSVVIVASRWCPSKPRCAILLELLLSGASLGDGWFNDAMQSMPLVYTALFFLFHHPHCPQVCIKVDNAVLTPLLAFSSLLMSCVFNPLQLQSNALVDQLASLLGRLLSCFFHISLDDSLDNSLDNVAANNVADNLHIVALCLSLFHPKYCPWTGVREWWTRDHRRRCLSQIWASKSFEYPVNLPPYPDSCTYWGSAVLEVRRSFWHASRLDHCCCRESMAGFDAKQNCPCSRESNMLGWKYAKEDQDSEELFLQCLLPLCPDSPNTLHIGDKQLQYLSFSLKTAVRGLPDDIEDMRSCPRDVVQAFCFFW